MWCLETLNRLNQLAVEVARKVEQEKKEREAKEEQKPVIV